MVEILLRYINIIKIIIWGSLLFYGRVKSHYLESPVQRRRYHAFDW